MDLLITLLEHDCWDRKGWSQAICRSSDSCNHDAVSVVEANKMLAYQRQTFAAVTDSELVTNRCIGGGLTGFYVTVTIIRSILRTCDSLDMTVTVSSTGDSQAKKFDLSA